MSNINDDEREGYATTVDGVGRNVVTITGTNEAGNTNDLMKNSRTLSGADEVKNIIRL